MRLVGLQQSFLRRRFPLLYLLLILHLLGLRLLWGHKHLHSCSLLLTQVKTFKD